MVSLLNGGLSDGNPKKRALENGYHCSSSGNTPNFKPQKISAARDFPPGCGPNAQQIIQQANQNVAVAACEHVAPTLGANCVSSESERNTQSCDVMKSPVRVDSSGNMVIPQLDTVHAVIQANGEIEDATQLYAEMETNEFKMPADMEQQEISDVPIGNSIPVAEKSDGGETSAEPEVQSHEILGSPIGMKDDISPDDLVGKVVAQGREGTYKQIKETVSDVIPMDIELPKDLERNSFGLSKELNGEEAQALVKQLANVKPLSLVKHVVEEDVKPLNEVQVKDDALPSPKDKFRRRRVSATRDFPPSCGTNDPSLAKEVCLRTTSGDEGLIGTEKGSEKNEELELSKGVVVLKKIEKSALQTSPGDTAEGCPLRALVAGGEGTKGNIEDSGFEGRGGKMSPPNRISNAVGAKVYEECKGSMGKEIILYEPVRAVERRPSNDVSTSRHKEEHVIVHTLMAAPYCPWRQGKLASSSDAVKTVGRANKDKAAWQKKNKAAAKKTIIRADSSKRTSFKMCEDADGTSGPPDVKDEGEYGEYEGANQDFPSGCARSVEVILPPYGPSSSSGDARNKVRETLRLFQTICRKLLQGEEAKMKPEVKRIDLEAVKIMKNKGKEVGGKKYLGAVPGVEVGDEFQYRVELAMVGVHRLYQAGIDYMKTDYMKHNRMLLAISIVASGAYADDMEDADSLIYSGQGGNILGKDKKPEDQKLERGNLALRNSITARNPVRVIHGSKETKSSDSSDSRSKIITTYVYDGLYTVENYWPEKGKHGNQVFMFKLKRIPGQPELAWKELKKSKKSKVRLGVCVDDIAGGKELIPICAVNTINNEKPPPFSYITKMMYTDWSHLPPPHGCDCTGRCSDSGKCSCALKNGGEIPYNRNGAIVEAKPLVYECGPSCRCPPPCYNRVSQHGIKLQLEIFKTETRGWGVRCLTSIPSGTFICEYVGELLEDKEAEQRTNDEYLFDIGQNYSDCSLNPDGQGHSVEPVEEVGYTIDAAYYGNVGRFINHSCSPNLYAQNVIYDHDDKRMPHIMLFAAENIPALKELTYHYNYSLDQVRDSNGNIKMKNCYCGSTECTGRMY